MSFNQNTKINNLYQIVYPINDIVDIQDISGIDISNNYNYSNTNALLGATDTFNSFTLGTITKPTEYTTTHQTNFYLRITGKGNPIVDGYMTGGAWIRDVESNIIAKLEVGNNRDFFGSFDISSNTMVNLSPSQFPLTVQEYIYFPAWYILGSPPFTCNVVMSRTISTFTPAFYSPTLNKLGYSSTQPSNVNIDSTVNINGDFSVDTNTLFVDASNNRVGIRTSTPAYTLDVSGSANINGNLSVDSNTLFVDASNNRVGIGKTNPSTTLDVSGSANITGNLSVDSNTLFVDASNNRVGIGKTNPSYPLDVNGSVKFTTLVDAENSVGTNGQVLISNGSALVWNDNRVDVSNNESSAVIHYPTFCQNNTTSQRLNIDKTGLAYQPSTNYFGIGTIIPAYNLDVSGTGRITGDLIVDSNTLFVDASNNRVGVGTITPSEKLTINSGNLFMNGTFDGMLMNPGSGAGSLAITRSGNFINNVQQINAPYTDNVGSTSGGGAQISLLKDEMTFSTYPNTGTLGNPITLTERMRIKSTGVGIGTTTPETRLDVVGNSIQCSNQGRFKGWYSGGQGSGLATEIGISSSEGFINAYDRTANTYGNLNLVAGSTANIRLQTNGNVGIGTQTPNYKLHVEGSGTANEVVGWFNNQGAFSSSIAVRQSAKTAYISNHYGLGTPAYNGQISNAISFGVASGAAPIQFWNGNPASAKMTILENGNTGINTSTPALSLDVSGGSIGNSAGNLTLNVNSTGAGGSLRIQGGTGILSATAGGTSGQHLVLTINGTPYKIKLENV